MMLIFLFFTSIILSLTHKVWALDVWWHLKTGEWIWTHQTVPRTDLYSYTAPHHPWIDLSWGFQSLLYLSYKYMGGVNGIIIFKVFVATAIFALLFLLFYRRVPFTFLLIVLSLALFTAHERLVERPEVLSYFFLVLYLFLIEKDRRKPTKFLYALPFLQIGWVNVHALFILGLLVLFSITFGKILSWLFSKGREPFPRRFCFIALLASFATIVNPYGLQGALFPRMLLTRISGEIELFTFGIGEFIRPLSEYDPTLTLFFYKALLLLGILSFLCNRNFLVEDGILFLVFAYLSLLARRNIAPFSFVSSFIILKNSEGLLRERPPFLEKLKHFTFFKRIKRLQKGFLYALVFFLPLPFMTGAFYERGGINKRFGLGVSPSRYPIEAAEFIEKTGLSGNGFNSGLDVGNYFVWRLTPRWKVFMDGRLEVYGEKFYEELFQLFNGPSRFPEWAEKYRINFCVVNHGMMRYDRLLFWLHQSRDWVPVYTDEMVIIFLKNNPENKETIQKYALSFEDVPSPEEEAFPLIRKRSFFSPLLDTYRPVLRKADLYAKFGLLRRAESLYRRVLLALPRHATLHYNLGTLLRKQGKFDEAFSEYEQALRIEPNHFLFHYGLGGFYLDMGKEGPALEAFKRSAALSPAFGETRYQLGRLYAKRGWWDKAEREYRQIIPSDSAYLSARNALGILYAQKGEHEKAEKEFRGILALQPDAEGVLNNLDRLRKIREKQ